MKRKHWFFVMVIVAVLISSLVPTQEALAINILKIVTAPVVYPVKVIVGGVKGVVKGVDAAADWCVKASAPRPVSIGSHDSWLRLTDGRGRIIVAIRNEIGLSKRTFRFGVKVNTIEVRPYERWVPYKYTYWWNGREHSKSINQISTVRFPASANTGYVADLSINVFYKKVRTIRNPHNPAESRQEVEIMKTSSATKTFILYHW